MSCILYPLCFRGIVRDRSEYRERAVNYWFIYWFIFAYKLSLDFEFIGICFSSSLVILQVLSLQFNQATLLNYKVTFCRYNYPDSSPWKINPWKKTLTSCAENAPSLKWYLLSGASIVFPLCWSILCAESDGNCTSDCITCQFHPTPPEVLVTRILSYFRVT